MLIGPFPEPTTGVSLANMVVNNALAKEPGFQVKRVNTSFKSFTDTLGKLSFKKMVFYASLNFQAYKVLNSDIVYLTPGQTFFGVAKYALFLLLAMLGNKEIIIHVHGNHLATEYAKLKGIKKKIFHFLLSKTTKGIVLSESLKANLSPFIKEERIFVLYNFAEDFLQLKNEEKDYSTLKIIFLSNLMLEKGIVELLDALEVLEKKGVAYSAKIAGNIDDENKEMLLAKINRLNHTDYLGIVKGEDKKQLLARGNIFVLPTYYSMEGQPISIIEAMAMGNLIVSTRHAGIPDIVENEINGYFVEKKNIDSLVTRLIALSENTQEIKRIGNTNKILFKKKFTLSNFKNTLLQIIESP